MTKQDNAHVALDTLIDRRIYNRKNARGDYGKRKPPMRIFELREALWNAIDDAMEEEAGPKL